MWCADTTHIPVSQGFFYLVAVMDWASRHVLSWRLSNTMDSAFCVEALDAALRAGVPEIFNTDQGAQFTNTAFTEGCAPTARAVPRTVAGAAGRQAAGAAFGRQPQEGSVRQNRFEP